MICLCLLTWSGAWAQRPEVAPNVFIYVEGNQYPMKSITSQTEKKKGWDIQGISVGGKFQRYFWGKKSKQLTDSRPKFAIFPKEYNLNDYAIIRLNERKSYRPVRKFDRHAERKQHVTGLERTARTRRIRSR